MAPYVPEFPNLAIRKISDLCPGPLRARKTGITISDATNESRCLATPFAGARNPSTGRRPANCRSHKYPSGQNSLLAVRCKRIPCNDLRNMSSSHPVFRNGPIASVIGHKLILNQHSRGPLGGSPCKGETCFAACVCNLTSASEHQKSANLPFHNSCHGVAADVYSLSVASHLRRSRSGQSFSTELDRVF